MLRKNIVLKTYTSHFYSLILLLQNIQHNMDTHTYELHSLYAHEAMSYHIIPFALDGKIGADNFALPADSFWERTVMKIDNDVFYRHIQDFLMSSVTKGKGTGARSNYEFLVYSLKEPPLRKDITDLLENDQEFRKFLLGHPAMGMQPSEEDSLAEKWGSIDKSVRREVLMDYHLQHDGQTLRKIMINKLLEQEFCLRLKDTEYIGGYNVCGGYRYIPFKIAENGRTMTFDSPKLMIYPDASVGLLVIPLAFNTLNKRVVSKQGMPDVLKTPITMFDFMAANNVLVKSKRTRKRVMPLRSCGIQVMESMQREPKMERFLQSEKKALVNTCNTIYQVLNMDNPSSNGISDYENFSFSFSDIIDFMLSLMHIRYERFNKKKSHIFTYLQIDEMMVPEDGLDNADFHCDFIRIVRGEHANFKILDNEQEKVYMQTFKNIYVGSSVEGGSILTIRSKNDDGRFIERFKEKSVDKRYFWIYILAYVQRMSLLNMVRELGGIDNTKDGNIIVPLRNLRDLYKRLSRIQVNTFYSAVSDISQHNQFYRLCTRNLGVELLLNEVDNKMNILSKCLQQEYDEEKEQMQKDIDRLHQQNVDAKERFGVYITLSVLLLAVFSGLNDLYDLLHNLLTQPTSLKTWIILIGVWLLFGFGLYKVSCYFYRHRKSFSPKKRNKK